MTVRLPTVGGVGGRAPSDGEPGGPVRSLHDRCEPPCPLVAIGGAVVTAPVLPFAVHLVRQLRERGVPVGALSVGRATAPRLDLDPEAFVEGSAAAQLRDAGAEPVGRLQAAGDRMEEALADAFSRMCPSDARPLVTLGNEVAALYHTAFTVLVTAGVAPPGWGGPARAIRDRLDLQLADPRPGVASGLAERIAMRWKSPA